MGIPSPPGTGGEGQDEVGIIPFHIFENEVMDPLHDEYDKLFAPRGGDFLGSILQRSLWCTMPGQNIAGRVKRAPTVLVYHVCAQGFFQTEN